jgi:two-component system, chemotaxis family, chemotaxis protein CheY
VDDEEEIRETVADCLTDANFRVVCASDGAEALRYLHANPPPDIILVDLFMPAMDGWQFIKRLEGDLELSSIPVVVMTAAGNHWGYPVPQPRLLHKPFQLDTLLRVVRSAMASGRGE